MLKQVKPIDAPWIAIIDHSISIGIKKVLVVLRVRMDIFEKREGAITLKDCECIGVKISTKVNGESIAKELKDIFEKSGKPDGVLKDRDYTLNKGVMLYDKTIVVIDDITHEVANALKKQFEKTKSYKIFMKILGEGATKLRQTDIAFLMPPKLRTKGRFQAIGNLTKWASKILDSKIFSKKGKAKKGSLLEKLRVVFPNFNSLKPFIRNFAKTTDITAQIMKILKNEGLKESTYNQCKVLLKKLPKNSKTRKSMKLWLEKHIKIQQQITTHPLPISSDIIESLFGKFKHIIYRNPQADFNKTTLLIPTLCGTLDENRILEILNKTRHKDLKEWEKENIPYTTRKQRAEFNKDNIQKSEINSEG